MPSIRLGVLILTLTASIASRGAAQPRRVGISGEFVIGSGVRTAYNGDTWYRGNRSSFGSVAIGLTLPGVGRLQPLFVVDRSSTILAGDHTSDCPVAPNGTCLNFFPGVSGYSAGAGLRARLANALDLDVTGGVGSMSGRSKYVAANLAVALSRHARIVAGVRHIAVQHSSGNELWWRPVTAGLRIQ
jgi:hypothetical protein